jgi:peptidoglycan/LPS O-acetylase OafA/YrhL
MLIGAWGALLYYNSNPFFIRLFTHKASQVFAWIIICLIAINRFHFASVLDNELVSGVAVILIIGQITRINRIINLENNLFDFLGKISYGIYVIHPLVIFGFSKLIGDITLNNGYKYLLVYSSIIGTTILLSYLSYEYFEKWFLRLKHKYTVIKTSATRNYSDILDSEAKDIYMEEKARPA